MSHDPLSPSRNLRGKTWLPTVALFFLVAAVWFGCLRSPWFWQVTGIGDTSLPFLDLYGLLAAGEFAHAHGNAFALNPLDPYHRPHFYTAWWLVTGKLGLTRADTWWVGLGLVGATLLAAVAFLRPRTWPAWARSMLVLCSPAVLMGVNRGNNDLEVFVLIVLALALLRARQAAAHWLGAILVALAGVLKYYPLAAGIVFLRARSWRTFGTLVGLVVLVLVLAWPDLQPGLQSAVRFKPHPNGLYAFGAPTVFRDFAIESPVGWWLLTLAVAGWAAALLRRGGAAETPPAGEAGQAAEADFACGAALIAGSFFLGASYVYKLIFAVLLLPWLCPEEPRAAGARGRRILWWLLLATLWTEGLLAVVINAVLTSWSRPLALAALNATLVLGQMVTWCLIAGLVYHVLRYGLSNATALLRAARTAPEP